MAPLLKEVEASFIVWLKERNKKEVKNIETFIFKNQIMFISDGIRWCFHYDYENNLTCSLQAENILLSDIVEPVVLDETLRLFA
ncbi:MAG: Unknown protein [uncultured Sulfurovum sp.]|uniref:Uncharacterized protein n=1 Tax=uncultured Sulfurovum sp. TaxID=269237 RepID=A0A6S6SVB5_9BACT|nr:MAG: Unknown protein [uncultured Sulfurovum sp.]